MKRNIPQGWYCLEMKDFLKFTPREVKKPKDRYLSLGIRSHCKGTFIREVENPYNVMMESLYIVKKDDLIVNITFAWEGAVALIKEADEGAFVSHRFPTYTFDRNIVIPEYFKYLIPSKRFIYELGIISPGGAGRNRVLNRKDFMHLQFVMPPIEEQKKIADILLTWDRTIETVTTLINKKTLLKKGLMQKLLTKGIGHTKFRKTLLGEIPLEWKVKRLNELGNLKGGSGFKIKYQGNKECNIPFYKVSDMNLPVNNIFMKDCNNTIDEQIRKKLGAYLFKENTIIFAKVGAALLLNRRRILNKPGCIDNNMMGFEVINEFYKYFYYCLQLIDFGKFINEGALPSVNQSQISELKVAVPPIPEQKKISNRVICHQVINYYNKN
ncbi:MAG: restriction endonuclease subunit S [Actinobacteria bacterium]|nr:restriction endonuclease subunit S [Actinomycetota bacterium]